MQQFEYSVQERYETKSFFGSERELNFLNDRGASGWRLTNISKSLFPESMGIIYYFCREIEVKTNQTVNNVLKDYPSKL